MKTYILQKDIIGFKVGTEFPIDKDSDFIIAMGMSEYVNWLNGIAIHNEDWFKLKEDEGDKVAVYEIFNGGDKVGFFFNEELAKTVNDYLNAPSEKSEQRTPLFKTEDGVDVFDGDKYISVRKSDFTIYDNDCAHAYTKTCFDWNDWAHFSTKEKADEFVLDNKPLLSRKDVVNLMIQSAPLFQNKEGVYRLHENLSELVKSKL
jgi:hypothetical protein